MSIPPPPGPQQPPSAPGPYQASPPQGPYPPPGAYPPPYQTWGQGYSPYNRPAPVNGVAIAALVLGALCFLPALGLVLGVVALVQIRKRGERGKGMAIGGIVLSTLGLALWVLALATGGASDFWQGVKEGARGDVAFSLDKGQCFNEPGALGGITYDVDEVPCEGVHDGEVFGTFEMAGVSRYPGDSAVDAAANSRCYTLADAYTMDRWALPDDVDIYYFTPSRDSWAAGDREIACVFGNMDEDGTLTGSLRADETTLNADQLAFVRADAGVETVIDQEPEDLAEDDLAGNKAWAGHMDIALGWQIQALGKHTWPAGVTGPMNTYLKDLENARKEWAKAAAARDATAFEQHYYEAYQVDEGASTVAVRRALRLAATPPSPGYGDSGGSGDAGDSGGSGDQGSTEV
ncbi:MULTISPECIES: DUF4190 domain-containing protein [unclassified Streptomyces]|uniref:DUF4190 domain-containing protein n=1 Tax=unclassified Streptomyces TaxID=2593676 RepID=UPI0036FC999E